MPACVVWEVKETGKGCPSKEGKGKGWGSATVDPAPPHLVVNVYTHARTADPSDDAAATAAAAAAAAAAAECRRRSCGDGGALLPPLLLQPSGEGEGAGQGRADVGIGEPPVAERGVGGLVSRLGRALAGGLVPESINQFTDPPSQRDHAQPSDQPTRILVGVDSTGGRQTQTDGLA